MGGSPGLYGRGERFSYFWISRFSAGDRGSRFWRRLADEKGNPPSVAQALIKVKAHLGGEVAIHRLAELPAFCAVKGSLVRLFADGVHNFEIVKAAVLADVARKSNGPTCYLLGAAVIVAVGAPQLLRHVRVLDVERNGTRDAIFSCVVNLSFDRRL